MKDKEDFDFMVVGQKKADNSGNPSFSLGKPTGKTLLSEDKQGITASLDKHINGKNDSFTLKGGSSTFGNTASYGLNAGQKDPVKPTPRHDVHGGIGAGGVKSRLKPSQKNFSFGRGVPFSGGHLQHGLFKSRLAKMAIGTANRFNPRFGLHGSEFKLGPTTIQGLKFSGAFPQMAFQQWSKAVAATYHDAEEESDE